MNIDESMKGWFLIVTEGGRSWIGKYAGLAVEPKEGELVTLEPAYSYNTAIVQDGRKVGFNRSIWPIELVCGDPFTPMPRITVTAAAVDSCEQWDARSRAQHVQIIVNAEDKRNEQRMARAGLVPATSMPVGDRGRGPRVQ